MDTEEDLKIQKLQQKGHPETDEGPYYHESWWESYKGSVKGKLGGIVIGALLGAAIGAASVAVLALATGGAALTGAGIAMTMAGFSAAGMLYGAHEFSDVGRVTGAVAAAHEKAESRMKAFETGKFAELKQEIRDLKATLTGKKPEASPALKAEMSAGAEDKHANYRTTHCDEHCPPGGRKWIFWKVAAVGALIGVIAGALLGAGGIAGHLLHALGAASAPLEGAGIMAGSMTAMGLFGASFGINRDIFRQVFDKTDLWFKGIFKSNGKASPQPTQATDKGQNPIFIYDAGIKYPESETYHRDKVLAQGKEALLSLDPTKTISH